MIRVDTRDQHWQRFCDRITDFLKADITEQYIDGKLVRGYRSPDNPALWIRDHSDIVRGGKYIEADLKSSVECFSGQQAANGRVFDYVLTSPLSHSNERENWEKWVRIPVEADVEFRFVKAAAVGWQATGDNDWFRSMLPSLDLALRYLVDSPLRWDSRHELVKRPYTIDTWDFDYTGGRADWLNFQITPDTYWGIFHGDNSGLYEAAIILSAAYERFGMDRKATEWGSFAGGLRKRANELLFNGRFYTHFYKLSEVTIAGVDESEQLSLSSPMAINRGLATPEIAASILAEYMKRRDSTDAFAEWSIIDPPFPPGIFGDKKLVAGAYVNGGVFPLCGGELAKAAFSNGFERYGLETLEQYSSMIEQSGETYLWYFRDGTPSSAESSTSPDATPTDGWGSSAMLFGFIEGLAGIVDHGHSFREVTLQPRWLFAEEEEATVEVSYAASGAAIGYRYRHDARRGRISVSVEGDSSRLRIRVPLPAGAELSRVRWKGESVAFATVRFGESLYAEVGETVAGSGDLDVDYRA